MDRNFKVRFWCGLGMLVVALVSLYTFNAIPFKILFSASVVVAAIELLSFLKKKFQPVDIFYVAVELILLTISVLFVVKFGVIEVWYMILGVCGYDVFAYLFGKLFGGKVFKNSRPFKAISKNKTWEGTIAGLAMSMLLVSLLLLITGRPDYIFLLSGPLGLLGDLYESFIKRRFKIKDSNEIVVKNKVFHLLEYAVGGTGGHGGYLDRIDSIALAATILYIIMA